MARIGAVLITIGTALMIVGTFAPWLTSVGMTANSWDLRDLVLALGFGDDGPFEIAVTLWAVVPIALATAAVTAWWGKLVLSAVLGAIGAVYGGIVAFAVLQAPDIDLYDVEWGVGVTFAAALLVLAGAVALIGALVTDGDPIETPSASAA